MDKFIKVADGHHVTVKQKGSVRIQMCGDNRNTFVATLYNVLLAPDLCDRLFSVYALDFSDLRIFSLYLGGLGHFSIR